MEETVITIRDLRMHYGEKEVLKGINLDVYRGHQRLTTYCNNDCGE